MNKVTLIELHTLPSLEYFCVLQTFGEIILEKHEHFVKQSYRNRFYINTSQGTAMLSIPLTEKSGKVLIKDVRIDYSTKWQNGLWRTLHSAYKSAPFFEHYESDFRNQIFKGYKFLFDLNHSMLSFCLESLKSDLPFSESVAYQKTLDSSIQDLRSVIQAKKPYSDRPFYKPIPYQQVFGNMFVPNLSFIDLLFCEGPNAAKVLRASQKYA
ncbi:MAG: WbqC family protein [Bacteroidia bacterium]|nr:WbqC family protein [Bacteroidia bacterium]